MLDPEVRILTEHEYDLWDQMVERSAQGTVYHLSTWITTTAKIFHLDYRIIGVFNKSEIIGGCFFYITDIFHVFKKGTTDVPFTKYGGFVFSYPKSSKPRTCETREHEIISLILEKIQTYDLVSVHLIHSPGLTDIRPFTSKGWRARVYYTYVKSLDEDIFWGLSYGARRCIRRAHKCGITIKKGVQSGYLLEINEINIR